MSAPEIVATVANLHEVPRAVGPLPEAELYRRLVMGVDSVAMILLDAKGHVRSWNPGAQAIKGYVADEIIGRSFETFYPEEAIAVDHPARELEIAALTGRYEEKGWRVRADGTRFWAHVLIVALLDEEGELLGFGKVTTDLTGERQRSEQVENTMRLLEATIRVDGLTGLPNRRAWDERIEIELARAARHRTPLTVAVIDLDYFKRVNDEFGHGEGDRLLKQAGMLWNRSLRPTDVLARYGGEEFALALPGAGAEDSRAVLDRVREATPGKHTCSIGAATLRPDESAADVFSRADRAMYQAKDAGRNRVVVA